MANSVRLVRCQPAPAMADAASSGFWTLASSRIGPGGVAMRRRPAPCVAALANASMASEVAAGEGWTECADQRDGMLRAPRGTATLPSEPRSSPSSSEPTMPSNGTLPRPGPPVALAEEARRRPGAACRRRWCGQEAGAAAAGVCPDLEHRVDVVPHRLLAPVLGHPGPIGQAFDDHVRPVAVPRPVMVDDRDAVAPPSSRPHVAAARRRSSSFARPVAEYSRYVGTAHGCRQCGRAFHVEDQGDAHR